MSNIFNKVCWWRRPRHTNELRWELVPYKWYDLRITQKDHLSPEERKPFIGTIQGLLRRRWANKEDNSAQL